MDGPKYSETSTKDIEKKKAKDIERNRKANEEMNKIAGDTNSWLGKIRGEDFMKAGALLTLQAYGAGKGLVNALTEGLKEGAGFVRTNVEEIRASYGGFFDDEFEYKAESAASNAMRRYTVLTQTYADEAGSAIMGTEKLGSQILDNISDRGNILENLIGSPAQAMKNIDNLLVDLSTTYGNEINKLSEESIVKMAFYEDALGTSASTLQNVFQKQIAFTGEISTDALDKLGAYADNISKELNIPMKYLTEMTTEIMSNTQMFGDITVEEATRMSAKLTQLGFTMEQLSSQQQKFGTFSGAAQAAGTIAQLTGAQVDAMKMSFLASEGRFDELIEYQQESLFKAGMTKQKFLNQSNAMRNAIADAFGRSQEEMAILLDKNRKVSSQEELDRIMKEGDTSEQAGFDRLLNNIDQTKDALKTVEELASQQKMRVELGMQEELYEALELKQKQAVGLKGAMEGLSQAMFTDRMKKDLNMLKEITNSLNPKDFAGNIEGYFEGIEKIAGPYISDLKATLQEAKILSSDGTIINASATTTTVDTASLTAEERRKVKEIEAAQKIAAKTKGINNIKVEVIDNSSIQDGVRVHDYKVLVHQVNSQGEKIKQLDEVSLKKQK